ncbi:glycosyltransferase [Bacteroides fluxus]|uniref:glycosyltransferase n=1 Tax=Bacteroides fluxus TaxID=626930 RepID=UPI0023A8E6AA|nr:glycosyltransferase [Bacteroides fluxus]
MSNILFFTSNEIAPSIGGVERVASIMFRELTLRGHKIYTVYYIKTDVPDKLPDQYQLPLVSKLNAKENLNFLDDLIRDKQINIVINLGGLYNNSSSLIVKACRDSEIPHISVYHNSFDSLLWSWHPFAKLMKYYSCRKLLQFILALVERFPLYKGAKYIYKYTHTAVVLSDCYIKEFRFFVNLTANRVVSICNPLPISIERRTQWAEKENIVLFVGRLDSQKGLDKMLRIWSHINSNGWKLQIVGTGPLESKLKKMAVQLSINNIEFLGHQSPFEFYRKAKIFCMTSLYEGYPMVLIESMAYGCVPIMFNSYSAAKDIAQKMGNGIAVKAFDEASFIKELMRLMAAKEELEVLHKMNLDLAERHAIAPIIDKWETLISKAIQSKGNQMVVRGLSD